MRKQSWSDVSGSITVEAERERLPPEFAPYFGEDGIGELVIHFTSSGYYDPGYRGTPDNCQAPEGDDERLVESATLDGAELPEALADKLGDLFLDRIYEAEVDYTCAEREAA
jgi:hypothetical protein